MAEETYKITLLCMNCWNKWEESIPKGQLYFSHNYNQSSGYANVGYQARDNRINCPNCECNTVRSLSALENVTDKITNQKPLTPKGE